MRIIEKIREDVYLVEHDPFGSLIREQVSVSGMKAAMACGSLKKELMSAYKDILKAIKEFESPKKIKPKEEKTDADKTD